MVRKKQMSATLGRENRGPEVGDGEKSNQGIGQDGQGGIEVKQGKKLTRGQKISIGKLLGEEVDLKNLRVIKDLQNTMMLKDIKTGVFHVVEKNEL